jgi:hypothetical protein
MRSGSSFIFYAFIHLFEDQDIEIARSSQSECSRFPVDGGDFLPPEIFIEIFRLCPNDGFEDQRMLAQKNKGPDIINGPWNLS